MNERLTDSIESYLRWRGSQDYSKNTLKSNRLVLTRFADVVNNPYTKRLNSAHVERYFDEAARTRRGSTLAGDHQALRQFFEWCRHTKRMAGDNNPLYGRRVPKASVKERRRIPVTDFPMMLEAADKRSPRDRALVAFLLYTLCRDSEARTVKVRDLNLNDGYVRVTVHKTRTDDMIPLSTELDREMRRWLTSYSEAVGGLDDDYYLFPSRCPVPIKDNGKIIGHGVKYRPDKLIGTARRAVQPVLVDIGFPTHDEGGRSLYEGAHTLRRSGARALFDALSAEGGYDHPLRIVQAMLHHKSVTMTERYIGVTADRRTRDELIRGRVMYPALHDSNVLTLAR